MSEITSRMQTNSERFLPLPDVLAAAPARFEELINLPHSTNFRQARAARSYQALIKAATTLFAQHGYEGVGTPEISEKAGVAVGTFYRYFDDKRQVFYEVARNYLVVAYHATLDGLTPETFGNKLRSETIAATVELLFNNVLAHPKMSRSITELALRDKDVAELRHAFDMACVARIASLLRLICDPAIVPDPDATAYVVYISSVEGGNWIAGWRGQVPFPVTRVKTALTAQLERTLFAPTPRPRLTTSPTIENDPDESLDE